MIFELLPVLSGWRREIFEKENVKVKENEEVVLAESDQSGWIFAAGIVYEGSPLSLLKITFYDSYGKKHFVRVNPESLYGYGVLGKSRIDGGSLTYYNDEENRYSVLYNPNEPTPFVASNNHKISFSFEAIGADALIEYFGYYVIHIVDRAKFVESLREVLGLPGVVMV